MSDCGPMHNHLLHGTNVKFVDAVVVNRTDRHGNLVAPNPREGEDSGRSLTLLQARARQARVQDGHLEEVVFRDAGSNTHLARENFAEDAGWPETGTGLSLQMARGRHQSRSTKVGEPELSHVRHGPHHGGLGEGGPGPSTTTRSWGSRSGGRKVRWTRRSLSW